MKLHVKKDDQVVILAGEDKGKKGRIIDVDRKNGRVFVEGLNLKSRHTKPNAKNPQGGIVKSPGSIHASNVALVDGKKTATKAAAEKAPAKKKAAAKKAAKKA